jgi:molybdopterin-guanine dinucleotide biosynthesis protein A
MIESITGVVLAGGKSSRMGENKALLPYRGKHLIDAPIKTLTAIFREVLLSVRNPDDYSAYPYQKITDDHEQIGPMDGIFAVLKSGRSRIFCAGCDMPHLNESLIRYLCGFSQFDAVIPVWDGKEQVLHAVYSEALLPSFQQSIAAQRYKITDALKSARVRYVEDSEIRRFDPAGDSFKNVNTPADYEKLR